MLSHSHGTRAADSHLNVSSSRQREADTPRKWFSLSWHPCVGQGGVDSCSQGVWLHPLPGDVRAPAVRRDDPPRTEQLIVSSSAPRSEGGNEGSLGILTYFCCCLKVHKSCVECEFWHAGDEQDLDLGVRGEICRWVSAETVEQCKDFYITLTSCHRNYSLALSHRPKWHSTFVILTISFAFPTFPVTSNPWHLHRVYNSHRLWDKLSLFFLSTSPNLISKQL